MSRRNRGFTLVEFLIVLAILGLLVGLTLAAVQKARAAAKRAACANNLRQIGIALHQSHESGGRFPPGIRIWNDKYLYASWIARILPHLGHSSAWSEMADDYAQQPKFVGPPPHRNLARPLPVVVCPAGSRQLGTTDENVTAGFTYYLGVSGSGPATRDGILYVDSTVRLSDIADGSGSTLLVGERPPSPDNHLGWWYAGTGQRFDGSADFLLSVIEINRTFRAPTCPHGPYQFQAGNADNMCDTFHFWSLHPGGSHFVFADGSVRFIRYSANDILPGLATRAGGESIAIAD